jgi:NADH-quinone oxidoreductase subunit N
VVICKVSRDGANASLEDLAGLHRRSPLLALTLGIGVFALAGIPPFVGFMGKFSLLSAALAKGHVALVIIAVVNTAIAIYYYLSLVREAYFRDPSPTQAPIRLDWSTRAACVLLITGIVALGVVPARIMSTITTAMAYATTPASASTSNALAASPISAETTAIRQDR